MLVGLCVKNMNEGVAMKRIATLLLVTGALLSGCVVYEPVHRDQGLHRGEYERNRDHGHDHDRGRGPVHERDSDRDGVPDRMDRRPYDRDRY